MFIYYCVAHVVFDEPPDAIDVIYELRRALHLEPARTWQLDSMISAIRPGRRAKTTTRSER